MAQTPSTTVRIDMELQLRLRAEASRVGLPWTKLMVMLAREALDDREMRRQSLKAL